MPYEGFKGDSLGCGGYDRYSLIRPEYHRRQIPIMASNEQAVLLPHVHFSLQPAFRPARRFESHVTAANGRTFASASNMVPYSEFPQSLMYGSYRGQTIKKEPEPLGMTSSSAYGSYFMVDGKPRPNTCPPITQRSLKMP